MSERHAKEAALRYQAALVNHVSDAIIGTTVTGAVTSWNPRRGHLRLDRRRGTGQLGQRVGRR